MKANSIKIVAGLIIAVFFASCSKDDKLDESGSGVISLGFTAGSTLKSTEGAIDAVYLSIKDANSEYVYNMERFELIKLNDGYLTENIELEVGDYTVTDFIVIDSSNTSLYLTPKEGSEFASYVDDPLPVSFTVTTDSTSSVSLQVVSADLGDADDYGYANFTFEIVGDGTTLEDGLVAYYPFNGNLYDATSNGHDGTNYGVIFAEDIEGDSNSAIYFDGSAYFSVSSDSQLNFDTTDFSVSLWVKTLATSTQMIFQKGGLDKEDDPQYWFRLNGFNGYIAFLTGNGNPPSDIAVYNGSRLGTATWHHLVCSRSTDSLLVYLDNQIITATTSTYQNVDNTQDLKFGLQITNGGNYNPFYGYMDEIRIYNRALSEDEIEELYEL